MTIKALAIPEVLLITPRVFGDPRVFFWRAGIATALRQQASIQSIDGRIVTNV